MNPPPSPPRLMLVSTELGVGGAERCLTRLALGLNPQEFRTSVVSLAPRPADNRGGLVRELEAAGVPIRFLDVTGPVTLAKGLARLRRAIEESRPRLIQSFLFHANVLCGMVKPRGCRWVAGVRVADPRVWRHWVQRQAARRMDKIVCVSQSVLRFCRDRERLPDEKLSVIPNGVDVPGLAGIAPLDWGELLPRRLTQPPLIFVGRLDPQKGLDRLLPILVGVVHQAPQTSLVVVGDGPQRDSLVWQAQHLGLAAHVQFVGWRDNAVALIQASEALVLPSRWEGMPNAVLEAMACGKPVLAAPVEGVVELLDDPRQIAEVGPEFASKLLELLQKPELAQQIGHRNRQRAEEMFSHAAMTAAYRDLYLSLLNRDL